MDKSEFIESALKEKLSKEEFNCLVNLFEKEDEVEKKIARVLDE